LQPFSSKSIAQDREARKRPCASQREHFANKIWLFNQHSSNAGDAVSLFLLIFSHVAQFIDANAPPLLFLSAALGPPRMLKSKHCR